MDKFLIKCTDTDEASTYDRLYSAYKERADKIDNKRKE